MHLMGAALDENVWDFEWDPTEEDPLLEMAAFVARFRRWERTDDHGMGLRPGLEPQAAMGDHILSGLGASLHYWKIDGLGPELSPRLVENARSTLRSYWEVRQERAVPAQRTPTSGIGETSSANDAVS